jgi:hypothetical protein
MEKFWKAKSAGTSLGTAGLAQSGDIKQSLLL